MHRMEDAQQRRHRVFVLLPIRRVLRNYAQREVAQGMSVMPGLGVGVGDAAVEVEGMVVGTTHSFAICVSATVGKTTGVGGLVVAVGGPTVAVGPPVGVGVAGAAGMTLTNCSMPSTG